MANTAVWYHTKLPQNLTDNILNDISDLKAEESLIDVDVLRSPDLRPSIKALTSSVDNFLDGSDILNSR